MLLESKISATKNFISSYGKLIFLLLEIKLLHKQRKKKCNETKKNMDGENKKTRPTL